MVAKPFLAFTGLVSSGKSPWVNLVLQLYCSWKYDESVTCWRITFWQRYTLSISSCIISSERTAVPGCSPVNPRWPLLLSCYAFSIPPLDVLDILGHLSCLLHEPIAGHVSTDACLRRCWDAGLVNPADMVSLCLGPLTSPSASTWIGFLTVSFKNTSWSACHFIFVWGTWWCSKFRKKSHPGIRPGCRTTPSPLEPLHGIPTSGQ